MILKRKKNVTKIKKCTLGQVFPIVSAQLENSYF